jgi:hypothetical protein
MAAQISSQRIAGHRRMAARSLSLSHCGAVGYLLRRQLIASNDVVSGMLAVTNVSRCNHMFAITREAGESYLLKQGIKFTPASNAASTVAGDAVIPRQTGLTINPWLPSRSRSVGLGSATLFG